MIVIKNVIKAAALDMQPFMQTGKNYISFSFSFFNFYSLALRCLNNYCAAPVIKESVQFVARLYALIFSYYAYSSCCFFFFYSFVFARLMGKLLALL